MNDEIQQGLLAIATETNDMINKLEDPVLLREVAKHYAKEWILTSIDLLDERVSKI